jgi:hypothetical protein
MNTEELAKFYGVDPYKRTDYEFPCGELVCETDKTVYDLKHWLDNLVNSGLALASSPVIVYTTKEKALVLKLLITDGKQTKN